MKKQMLGLSIIALFAGINANADYKKTSAKSIEEMKVLCGKVEGNGKLNQVQAKSFNVTCNDRRIEWVPNGSANDDFPRYRTISFSADGDKGFTQLQTRTADAGADQTPSCPIYKQVNKTFTASEILDCQNDILSDKYKSIEDFCLQTLETHEGKNPAWTVSDVTPARVVNGCIDKSQLPAPPAVDHDGGNLN